MLVLLLLLLLLSSPLCAQTNPLSFADSLVAEGDHYRAITEYKRFLHDQPHSRLAPRAQLAIATSLLAGERWQQADQALEKVWQNYPDSAEAILAREKYAAAAAARGASAEARRRYQSLKQLNPADQPLADYQIGLSHFDEGNLTAAGESFAKLDSGRGAQLQTLLDDYRQLPKKSPALAGTLSALLPGAGQLYSERPHQAAVAFVLNGAFIYGAIEAWNNENYAVAGLLSLFEIGWYGGNIVNAVNNAHKYNHQQRASYRERFKLSLGLLDQTGWLQAQYRF